MSVLEERQYVCKVFAAPMGITNDGQVFPFTYLQCTVPGSRTLCVPSVSSSFLWAGKKVYIGQIWQNHLCACTIISFSQQYA